MDTLTIFRIIAKEFAGVADEEVLLWISLCEPFVSAKRFGKLYCQALALLTAHRMKLANVGASENRNSDTGDSDNDDDDDLEGAITEGAITEGAVSETSDILSGLSGVGVGSLRRISRFTEGDVTVCFDADTSIYKEHDAELVLTSYGTQFIAIRRMRIVSITSSAEGGSFGWT